MTLTARAWCVARARATRAACVFAACWRADSVSGFGSGLVAFWAWLGRATGAVGRVRATETGAAAGATSRSACGVRTSETPAALADVCDRRAAFDWRAARDFFAIIIPPYFCVWARVLLARVKGRIEY